MSMGRLWMPRVVEVAIADTGRGVDGILLRRAVRFGDSDRFNDRSGLGRYGMGLPNASVSQCERFEVYSWRKRQHPLWTYVDVQEVASGKLTEVPEPVKAAIPPPYEDIIDANKAPLVVWRSCDKFDKIVKLQSLHRS